MLGPEYDTNLHAATSLFWKALHSGGSTAINDLISPDCQYTTKNDGIDCAGDKECVQRLIILKTGIIEFEKSCSKLKIAVKVNRRKKTSRFLVTSYNKSFDFSLGFFLLWECGIITGIKVIEDAPKDFLESTKHGKDKKRHSQVQNEGMRARTGKAHYKWRQQVRIIPTGVVVNRNDLFNYIATVRDSSCSTVGEKEEGLVVVDAQVGSTAAVPQTLLSPTFIPAEPCGESEEIFVPIGVAIHTDFGQTQDGVSAEDVDSSRSRGGQEGSSTRTEGVCSNDEGTLLGERLDCGHLSGRESTSQETMDTTCTNLSACNVTDCNVEPRLVTNRRLRFDSCVHAALIQERCELPPEGIFYTAVDIHQFAEDFGKEVRNLAYDLHVSCAEAVDIYYGRNKKHIPETYPEDAGDRGWYPGESGIWLAGVIVMILEFVASVDMRKYHVYLCQSAALGNEGWT